MSLPEAFLEQMQRQLGPEFPAFLESLAEAAPVSIRLNPKKADSTFQENSERVKWSTTGVYLPERPSFTLDPLFHAGVYYVQEASSMFVEEAVRQLLPGDRPVRALDLAAAPGGKSTLLAATLPENSFLLANEVIRGRYQVLRENLIRWGYPNTHTSNHDPKDFAGLAGFFDLLLVDAPCSGEGLFRKDPAARQEWSPAQVESCSARQRRILSDSLGLLRPGGLLLYSTCTYNETENEANAAWLQEEGGLEPLEPDIPMEWNLVRRSYGYQFYPHRVAGEGFYLAAFRRPQTGPDATIVSRPFRQLTPLPRRQREELRPWLAPGCELACFQKPQGGILVFPESHLAQAQHVAHHLSRLALGSEIGAFKGKDFIPSHELALSVLANPDLPAVDLDREQALRFLKRETPDVNGRPPGWTLARYQGHNLGWMKILPNRVNNYLPKEWRIRMELKNRKTD